MELYGNSDCSSDCSASEGDVVSPLDSSQISNSTTSRKRITSQFIIIKLLVDVDQSLHTRRMVPQFLLV